MYYRIYPSKNNTIFQNFSPGTDTPLTWSQTINAGKSPVLELRDGSSQSKLLFSFVIPDNIKSKLAIYNYSCNLKLFDAGSINANTLPMKNINVSSFTNDFSEGNGWFFNQANGISGVSNWINNLDGNLWSNVSFTTVVNYNLNNDNEDLYFNVKSAIVSNISSASINLAISVTTPQLDNNILAKLIYSSHTKTMFQPYLELIIEDDIIDNAYNMVAGQTNKLYFINENGLDFSDTVTANVLLNDATPNTPEVIKVANGIYFITITPTEPIRFNKKEYISVIWGIGIKDVYKQILEVQPQNQLVRDIDYRNMMFYPTTPYTNNIIRQGDIIPFELISQVRGKNDVVLDTYFYRIVSQDGFELCPWTQVSVYRDRMYFYVDTSYFYPELTYEVFVQNNVGNMQMTSNTSYKFKLIANDASHLRNLSASPYYNRPTQFSK